MGLQELLSHPIFDPSLQKRLFYCRVLQCCANGRPLPDDDDNLGQALLQSSDFHPDGFEGKSWLVVAAHQRLCLLMFLY